MTELRRREHARSVRVAVRSGERNPRHERCEFTGGRDDPGDERGVRLFGGPGSGGGTATPEDDDNLAAPVPPWPAAPEQIGHQLRSFAARIGGEVRLRHQVVATGRSVCSGAGAVRRRTQAVFALTGEAVLPGGRSVPIGISGPGTGLDVLADLTVGETFGRIRSLVARATGPVRGTPAAVLRPQAAAILVHEAVGHYAEAMHVGAPAVHRLNTRVAAECLSVHDGAGSAQGLIAGTGSRASRFDDEGVLRLGATQVVEAGVLVAQLHSRATARAAGSASTGNARAAQVWDPPIPRMSTLTCDPGTASEEEMLAAMGSGVYLHRLADGYRQGSSVAAGIVLGEYVERGRRTGRYFTGGSVEDRSDVLTRLAELGSQVQLSANAMCGKDDQLLFDVATAAPAMRLTGLRLSL